MKEKDTQKAILDYLRLKKYFCWKNSTTGIYVKARDAYIPSQNVGSPDIFVVKSKEVFLDVLPETFSVIGQIYGIEVKQPSKYQTPGQKQWQKNFEKAGGIYIIARSIDDVEKIL